MFAIMLWMNLQNLKLRLQQPQVVSHTHTLAPAHPRIRLIRQLMLMVMTLLVAHLIENPLKAVVRAPRVDRCPPPLPMHLAILVMSIPTTIAAWRTASGAIWAPQRTLSPLFVFGGPPGCLRRSPHGGPVVAVGCVAPLLYSTSEAGAVRLASADCGVPTPPFGPLRESRSGVLSPSWPRGWAGWWSHAGASSACDAAAGARVLRAGCGLVGALLTDPGGAWGRGRRVGLYRMLLLPGLGSGGGVYGTFSPSGSLPSSRR